ncbi:MAG: accessory factor UbiK family protein [Gammaproteobacteria bacterium]|nr:accessory factor UbiK family protein [Gammaproteobacteria bacterium]
MASFSTRQLEELAAQLARMLPASMRSLREELERNFRAVLRDNLDRLELVSRDRFDVQAALLARAQRRLAELEQRLSALEAQTAPTKPVARHRGASRKPKA